MRLVCQQPHYLPWLGYFELLTRADAFTFLDDAQWIRQGRQHRTRILLPGDQRLWLTVPVRGHGHRELKLKDMKVDRDQRWARRHWESIRAAYGRAPHFRDQVEPTLRPFFEKAATLEFLVDVTQESLFAFWEPLGLSPELHWASDYPSAEQKTERLVSLSRTLGAEEYYSILGSTRYLDLAQFRAANVRVRYQHYAPSFPGQPRRPLELSIVDWAAHLPWDQIRARLQPLPSLYSTTDRAHPSAPPLDYPSADR